jgi:RNA polymerase sigma-70 factor (ECF subfamily)
MGLPDTASNLCTSGNDIFGRSLVCHIPALDAYARRLSRSRARSDDLVQETLLRALRSQHRFQADTNMEAWLFTILRNQFYRELRQGNVLTEDVDGERAAQLSVPPNQDQLVDYRRLLEAMQRLSPSQQQLLTLIARGSSYAEMAQICGCETGTLKSRIWRTRVRLLEICKELRPRARTGS